MGAISIVAFQDITFFTHFWLLANNNLDSFPNFVQIALMLDFRPGFHRNSGLYRYTLEFPKRERAGNVPNFVLIT